MPLDGFISDKYFFSPIISLLVESNSKDAIIELIKINIKKNLKMTFYLNIKNDLLCGTSFLSEKF